METIHTIRAGSPLAAWSQLIVPWDNLVADYVETYTQRNEVTDAPYWYGEQASVSLLAGAAWRVPGALALQEYATVKEAVIGGSYRGRGDLWFRFQGDTSGYIVESKIMWPETPDDHGEELERMLVLATKDAARARGEEPDLAVGVVFVVPAIAPRNSASVDSFVAQFQNQLNRTNSDATFHTFPHATRHLRSTRSGRIYPGIAVVARAVK